MTQAGQATTSDPKPGLPRNGSSNGPVNSNSVFDVFTTDAGGEARLVLSVASSLKAAETACRLSRLMPGGYFGYFERINEAPSLSEIFEATREAS
jgi:hypothetical protein